MRRFDLFAYSLVLGLTACGGGGGDGGGGASGVVNGRSAVPPQTALTYSGVSTDATVSATNAAGITANVAGSSGAALGGRLLSGVSAQVDSTVAEQPGGAMGLARRIAQTLHLNELGSGNGGALAGAVVGPMSIPCDSGSINLSGTISDTTGQGTANVDYIDCRTGSDTLNGPGQVTINSYDQVNRIVTSGAVDFTRVRFTGAGINFDLTGRLEMQVNVGNARETLTLRNVVTQDNNTGRQTSIPSLTFVNQYSTVTHPTFFTQSINGSVCDETEGCVTISTETAPFTAPWGPLYFATSSQAYPDWGIINLAGGTGRVRVTSLGVDLAKIEVDDGSGTFGTPARLRWSELGSALGANLADSDGDGMHDSWEAAKGLDPASNDANGDADGDGFSNLTEYLAGSDAGTSGSVPSPVRHVWVTQVSGLAANEASSEINVFVNSTSSGVMLNSVTGELGAAFSSGATPTTNGASTTPDSQGRTFTITPTASPTTWTITSSTGATLTLNSVAGTNPTSLVRYGAHGLAFMTDGTASPGYVYLVESAALIP